MKRITYYISVLCLTLLMCSGCTQNNGRIGPLFGSWLMTEYTVDGQKVDFPADDYTTLSFQGEIVRFSLIDESDDEQINCYGSWQQSGSTITLDFDFRSDNSPEGNAPYWLELPAETCTFTISGPKDGRFTLAGTGFAAGYILHFERTW